MTDDTPTPGDGSHTGKMLTTLEELEMPDDLTDRQKEVLKLKMRGMSQRAIAKVLGIQQPVVSRHLGAIKKKFERDGKLINQDAVVGESLALFNEVEHRAWELYYTAKNAKKLGDANKALNLVLTSREKALNVLMDLGLIKRAAVEHEHKMASPLMEQWKQGAAQKKMVITQVIQTQLEELDEPAPPDDIEDAELIEMPLLAEPTPPEGAENVQEQRTDSSQESSEEAN